jgi:hypothetical protein
MLYLITMFVVLFVCILGGLIKDHESCKKES